MMRKARLLITAAIIVIFAVALTGCGKDSASSNGAGESSTQPTIQELAKEDAKAVGFDGEVFATTYQEGKDGYLIAESERPDRIVIIDKKNQRMAFTTADTLPKIQRQISGKRVSRILISTYTIPKDSKDQDAKAGEWEGDTHKLPIYALFDVDDNGKVIPGKLTTGYGLAPSHYQTPLYEAKNVDMANILLTDALDLLPNLKIDNANNNKSAAKSVQDSKSDANSAYPKVNWRSNVLGRDINSVLSVYNRPIDYLSENGGQYFAMGIATPPSIRDYILYVDPNYVSLGLKNNKVSVVAEWINSSGFDTVSDFIRYYCRDNSFFTTKPKLGTFTFDDGDVANVMCWKIDGGYFIIGYFNVVQNPYENPPFFYTLIDDISLSKAFAK